MGKSGEATKSLEDFETKAWNEPEIFLTWIPNAGERWTYDAIRKQAEAFQRFGFDNRRALLDIPYIFIWPEGQGTEELRAGRGET
jgi:hypothetical protein